MLTDRAFACLLIAALLLCGAARQVVSAIRQEAEASTSVTRQGALGGVLGGALGDSIAHSRGGVAQNGIT